MSAPPRDSGATLVELLVAMGLFSVVGTILLGFALATGRVTDDTRSMTALSEETRLATERMSRELRQAALILDVTLPASPGDPTALTFWTDFNGNGVQDLSAGDPEVLTYRWTPATGRLTLTASGPSGNTTQPILAASVSAFVLQLRSSAWQYDADGDGIASWQEIDRLAGNANGVPDAGELRRIDLVGVEMTASEGGHQQTYRTQVDLRNSIVS